MWNAAIRIPADIFHRRCFGISQKKNHSGFPRCCKMGCESGQPSLWFTQIAWNKTKRSYSHAFEILTPKLPPLEMYQQFQHGVKNRQITTASIS